MEFKELVSLLEKGSVAVSSVFWDERFKCPRLLYYYDYDGKGTGFKIPIPRDFWTLIIPSRTNGHRHYIRDCLDEVGEYIGLMDELDRDGYFKTYFVKFLRITDRLMDYIEKEHLSPLCWKVIDDKRGDRIAFQRRLYEKICDHPVLCWAASTAEIREIQAQVLPIKGRRGPVLGEGAITSLKILPAAIRKGEGDSPNNPRRP